MCNDFLQQPPPYTSSLASGRHRHLRHLIDMRVVPEQAATAHDFTTELCHQNGAAGIQKTCPRVIQMPAVKVLYRKISLYLFQIEIAERPRVGIVEGHDSQDTGALANVPCGPFHVITARTHRDAAAGA